MAERLERKELKSKGGSRSKKSNMKEPLILEELCPPNEFVNGMIFVCDERTTVDMFRHQIFGLPLPYLREMKLLVPHRSALFLIEKQTALIRGIFVPTSGAKKCINEKIWSRNNACSFPAQIKFMLHSSYPALPKNCDLSPSFLRRMKIKGKFLDKHRVDSLIKALERYQDQQKSRALPPYMVLGMDPIPPPPSFIHYGNPSVPGVSYVSPDLSDANFGRKVEPSPNHHATAPLPQTTNFNRVHNNGAHSSRSAKKARKKSSRKVSVRSTKSSQLLASTPIMTQPSLILPSRPRMVKDPISTGGGTPITPYHSQNMSPSFMNPAPLIIPVSITTSPRLNDPPCTQSKTTRKPPRTPTSTTNKNYLSPNDPRLDMANMRVFNPMYQMHSPVGMFPPPPQAYTRMVPPLSLRAEYDREPDYTDSYKPRDNPLEQSRQNPLHMGMIAPMSPQMGLLQQAASNDFFLRDPQAAQKAYSFNNMNMIHNDNNHYSPMGNMDKFDETHNMLGTHV